MAEKAARLDTVVVKGQARPMTSETKALTVKVGIELYTRLVDHVARLRPTQGKDISNQVVLETALRNYLDAQ